MCGSAVAKIIFVALFLFISLYDAKPYSKLEGSFLSNGVRARDKKLKAKKATTRLQGGSSASASVTFDPPTLALTSAHWMSASDTLLSLQVSETTGLSSAEAEFRLQKYGRNELPPAPTKSLLALIAEQFEDRLVQILLSVAVLSATLAFFERDMHAFTEPLVILSILVLNAVVGIWQSQSAEDSLEALKNLQPNTACVLRDGAWIGSLPTAQIVPGDIIYLRVGDKVCIHMAHQLTRTLTVTRTFPHPSSSLSFTVAQLRASA